MLSGTARLSYSSFPDIYEQSPWPPPMNSYFSAEKKLSFVAIGVGAT